MYTCDFFVYKYRNIFLIVNCDAKYIAELIKDFEFIFATSLKPKKRVKYKIFINDEEGKKELKTLFNDYDKLLSKILKYT